MDEAIEEVTDLIQSDGQTLGWFEKERRNRECVFVAKLPDECIGNWAKVYTGIVPDGESEDPDITVTERRSDKGNLRGIVAQGKIPEDLAEGISDKFRAIPSE